VVDACRNATGALISEDMWASTFVLAPKNDVQLHEFCKSKNIPYIAPNCYENDLFTRYQQAAELHDVTHIVRITGDCWAMQFPIIVAAVKSLEKADYVCNTIFRTYPEGFDVQACSREAFNWLSEHQKENREHPFFDVDQNVYVRQEFCRKFRILELIDKTNPATMHTSIDTTDDLGAARQIAKKMTAHTQRIIQKV